MSGHGTLKIDEGRRSGNWCPSARRFIRPVERQRMRPWLIEHLDKNDIVGLCWNHKRDKIFRIAWKHAANQGFSMEKDTSLFEKWAIHTGRHYDSDHKRWKANFRCALNSLPDVVELKDQGVKKGNNAFKVYRFLDEKDSKVVKEVRPKKKKEPVEEKRSAKPEDSGSSEEENTNTTQEDQPEDTASEDHVDHNYAETWPPLSVPSGAAERTRKKTSRLKDVTENSSNQSNGSNQSHDLSSQQSLPAAFYERAKGKVNVHRSIDKFGSALGILLEASHQASTSSMSSLYAKQALDADSRTLQTRVTRSSATAGSAYLYLCQWCEQCFPNKEELFQHFVQFHKDMLVLFGVSDDQQDPEGAEQLTVDSTESTSRDTLQQEIAVLEKQVLGHHAGSALKGQEQENVIEDGEVADLTLSVPLDDHQHVTYMSEALDLSVKSSSFIDTTAQSIDWQAKQDEALDLSVPRPEGREIRGSEDRQNGAVAQSEEVQEIPRQMKQIHADLSGKIPVDRRRSKEDFLHAEILMSLKSGGSHGQEDEMEDLGTVKISKGDNLSKSPARVKKAMPTPGGVRVLEGRKDLSLEDFERMDSEIIPDLKEMIQASMASFPYKCVVCGRSYLRDIYLVSHLRTHNGLIPFKCGVCLRTFADIGTLRRHIKSHRSHYMYQCDLCPRGFQHSLGLKLHLKDHKMEEGGSLGRLPDHTTKDSDSVTSDAKSNDNMKSAYQCSICGKRLRRHDELKIHILSHQSCTCKICGKEFENLASHMKKHTEDKPYICNLCDKTFSFSSALSAHVKSHLRQKLESSGKQDPIVARDLPNILLKRPKKDVKLGKEAAKKRKLQQPGKIIFTRKTADENKAASIYTSVPGQGIPFCPIITEDRVTGHTVNEGISSHVSQNQGITEEAGDSSSSIQHDPHREVVIVFPGMVPGSLNIKMEEEQDERPEIPEEELADVNQKQVIIAAKNWNNDQIMSVLFTPPNLTEQGQVCPNCNAVFSDNASYFLHSASCKLFSERSESDVPTIKIEPLEQTTSSTIYTAEQTLGEVAMETQGIVGTITGGEITQMQLPVSISRVKTLKSVSGAKNYKCLICRKLFSTYYRLRLHKITHLAGDYQCERCSRTFRERNHLVLHKFDHVGQRFFTCSVCGMKMGTQAKMKKHARFHRVMGIRNTRKEKGCLSKELGPGQVLCAICLEIVHQEKTSCCYTCRICGHLCETQIEFVSHLCTHPKYANNSSLQTVSRLKKENIERADRQVFFENEEGNDENCSRCGIEFGRETDIGLVKQMYASPQKNNADNGGSSEFRTLHSLQREEQINMPDSNEYVRRVQKNYKCEDSSDNLVPTSRLHPTLVCSSEKNLVGFSKTQAPLLQTSIKDILKQPPINVKQSASVSHPELPPLYRMSPYLNSSQKENRLSPELNSQWEQSESSQGQESVNIHWNGKDTPSSTTEEAQGHTCKGMVSSEDDVEEDSIIKVKINDEICYLTPLKATDLNVPSVPGGKAYFLTPSLPVHLDLISPNSPYFMMNKTIVNLVKNEKGDYSLFPIFTFMQVEEDSETTLKVTEFRVEHSSSLDLTILERVPFPGTDANVSESVEEFEEEEDGQCKTAIEEESMRQTVLREKPYPCGICDQSFDSISVLRSHLHDHREKQK